MGNKGDGVVAMVALAGSIATFTLGPIDLARTAYNFSIGDAPVMKLELGDYVRRNLAVRAGNDNVEDNLAATLGTTYTPGEKVDLQKVSTEVLWDASEDYAPSTFERWFWSPFKQ